MPIQIEQKLPRCSRCGKIVPAGAPGLVTESTGSLFCTPRCQDEYHALHDSTRRGETEVNRG